MKRVIKFRAWDSKSNKWFDDFILYPNGKIAGVNHAYGNIHVMQFTGLLDKSKPHLLSRCSHLCCLYPLQVLSS